MRCANFICALICYMCTLCVTRARVACCWLPFVVVWCECTAKIFVSPNVYVCVLFTVLFWPHRISFQYCYCFFRSRHCMLSVTHFEFHHLRIMFFFISEFTIINYYFKLYWNKIAMKKLLLIPFTCEVI